MVIDTFCHTHTIHTYTHMSAHTYTNTQSDIYSSIANEFMCTEDKVTLFQVFVNCSSRATTILFELRTKHRKKKTENEKELNDSGKTLRKRRENSLMRKEKKDMLERERE